MNQNDEYKPYEEENKGFLGRFVDKENEEETFYNDGEDKKPKIVLMIIGIVLLIIILLIVLLACSNKKDTKVSTYLKTIMFSDATITPEFDKEIFEYEVASDKDAVIIRCEAENKKSTVTGCNKQIYITEVCKKHKVKVMTKGEKTQEYTFNLCKKDSNAPVIKEIKISPETLTNSSVKVTIIVESNTVLHSEPYSFDEGKTWQKSNQYEVTENKVLNIRVRDEDGRGTSETIEITNIDKTKPKVIVDGSVKSGTTTSSNVELMAEITPNKMGETYKYQWYKDNKKINGATKSTYLATTSGTYKVVVTIGSGNSISSNTYKVVKSSGSNKYTLSITSVSGNPSDWTKGNVTLKVNAKASNGLHDTAYSFDGGKTFQKSNAKQFTANQEVNIVVRDKKNNKTTYKVKITKIDKTQAKVTVDGNVKSGTATTSNVQLTTEVNPSSISSGYKYQWYKDEKKIEGATKSTYTATTSGNYKVIVTTGSGNTAISNTYKVVKTNNNNYTLTITSVSGNPSSWTKGDATLKVNATASNGLHATAYSFDGGKTFQNSNTKQFTKNQEVNIVVRDKKNNKTTYKVKITKIDKTKPVINIVGDKYVNSTLTAAATPASTVSGYKYQWYKDNKAITGATSKTYTPTSTGTYKVIVTTGAGEKAEVSNFGVTNKPTPTVTLKSSEAAGKWTKKSVTLTATIANGKARNYIWYKDNNEYKDCTKASCTLSTTQNANYKVKVSIESNSSITSSVINVKIDKTNPTVPTITLNPNKESASNVSATIKAGIDDDSGLEKVQYSYDKSTWTTYSKAITVLKTTGAKTIYARSVDNLGNVSKVVSATAKCDKDTVTVSRESFGADSKGAWFKLNFKQKYTGLSGITAQKYQYAYWKATKTTHTENKESSLVGTKCGTAPPSTATIRTTTNAKTISLYQKYKNQYYCFAVRPYRSTEISNLNRWTVQWKLAVTTATANSSSYNGN